MPTYYITTEEEIKALWKKRDEARAEADRLRAERNAYMQALEVIRADHSQVGIAGTVLYHYGRIDDETQARAALDAEDGDE